MMSSAKCIEEFVEKESEDFLCTICLCIPSPSSAVEAVCCGSFFCTSCLSESRRQKQVCPNCNGSFASCPPRAVATGNKFAHKKLLGLLVGCESKNTQTTGEEKCTWRGAWGDVAGHLTRCEHATASCAWNRCAVIASRRALRTHEPVCEFRSVKCEFCEFSLPHHELQKHLQTCNRFPIECTCEEKGIVRETHLYHVTYHCPDSLVECDVEGCPDLVKMKDLASHTSSCGYRKVPCNLCNTSVHSNSLPRHYGVDCPRVVVNCPHACDVGPMVRTDLPAHLSTCQSVPVTCAFTGCSEKVPQKDVEKHMRESNAEHIHVLFQQVSMLEEKVSSLSATVLRHERTITHLTDQNLLLVERTNDLQGRAQEDK